MYDTSPKDEKLTYSEIEKVDLKVTWLLSNIYYKLLQEPNNIIIFFWIIFQVPRLAVTPEIFARTFDLNKDGHLTVAEMAAAVFAEKY